MKKIVNMVCVLVILMMASASGIITAKAATYEEECDIVFLEAFEQILCDEGIVVENIEIIKDPIFDLSLNQLGYIYTMETLEKEGFALIVNTDGIFEVTEIYLEGTNPYGEYEGEKIYANLFTYLVYENEQFIETSSGLALNEEMLEKLQEKAFYSASNPITTYQEVIYYTSRTMTEIKLCERHPAYLPTDISNGCTPTAGANIIGYYTRFFPELIPGFTPGGSLLDRYVYTQDSTKVTPVIHTLYDYMQTNVTAPGTTISEFKQGMNRYCNEKGRSITYTSCMQNGNFSYELTKQRFQQGLPMVLFVDKFSVVDLMNSAPNNNEVADWTLGNVAHAMAGFGTREITYTLTNGQIRSDKYIAVATGLGNQQKGFYNFNYNTQIDEIYAINIY